jgi:hypothetical protein
MLMSIFRWFETRETDEFARSIGAELVKRVAPASLEARDEASYPAKLLQSWTYELVTLITLKTSVREEPDR